ncbi:tricalbin [Fomitopsis serialis]|uniref:tricalbin n=1 Tax=Fomitopsis serialis TaxID=139415 RepID=UPI002007B4C4|nr:tricalbin [Neoantrodia serialis]KAH9919105.1 tricalbin [Neoantrodia serialis]
MPGDVSSSSQAQAQVNGIVKDDAAKNRVPVHTFDPNASPEAKGVAAGKGKDKLKRDRDDEGAGEKEIPVDNGAPNVVPTITIEDMSTEPEGEVEHSGENAATDAEIPGSMPSGPASVIPEWYKVGWREVGGIDAQHAPEGEEKDRFVLQAFIKEQYYGEWYHNAAIIVVSVIVSHFMTRFNFGWGWLFVLLAFCNTYYATSMTRVRRHARDDIQRELVKTRLDTDFESADWINNFLDRFWLIYEPVLSQTIIASVDQILSTNCPSFLESLRMSTFTLGTKAPRIDMVKTNPRTADDVVLMDWGISFNPNDDSNLTKKQAEDKVNPKIVLSVRVGKGIASATIPILLENIEFTGVLRVRMKLMTTFPHVQLVDLSFTEKPHFDWILKPIGGETFGFDIGFIPGLSSFIREMVHATLSPMMYDPNVFTLNLEQLLSGAPLDTAVGVLQVTVQSARGLKGTKIGGGTPDPYVSLSINNRSELARTKHKGNTVNPTWMETKFLLVNNLTESLILSLMDYNDHRKDSEIGSAYSTLEGLEAPILKDGKEKGSMRFDVTFHPVLKPEVDSGGKELLPMDTKVGIQVVVRRSEPLPAVYTGTNATPIFTTNKVKHTNNPVWDASTEFLCTDRGSSVVTIKVVDDRDFLKDPIIGYLSVRLEDLLQAAQDKERDWWPLSHCRSGRPLNMPGSVHGADQYVAPIGVVRLWLKKATDVKNVEAALGGKSDPYVRVQINNITQGRTEVVNNNLNPEWDQIIYIPVHSLKETMMLECMDYQHLTKDRSLGNVELKVAELAKPAEGDFLFASTGRKAAEEPIMLDHGSFKGKLHYEAEFVPAIPVKGIGFESVQNEIEQATKRTSMTDTESGTFADDRSSTSSLRRERAASNVIEGVTASRPLGASEKPEQDVENGAAPEAPAEPATNGDVPEEHRPEEEGLELSKEELLKYQSGIIMFNVISGQLHKKARLEVLLDDAYWPAFSTVRPRSSKAHWEYIGEGFVKELDFGRVWLRLNEADEGDKDDVIAEWKGDAKPFLERAMDGPTSFELLHSGDEDKKSVVQLEARYLPVPVKLEPRESVNNQGMLRVDLLDAHDLLAVDRGGKSDPFAVFQLNGHKVYKSQTKKKTLNPEWNEDFVVQVPSRVSADFIVDVYDWDQLGKADILGSGKINLADIEPFNSVEHVVQLSLPKNGQKGSIRIRLLFQPEIIVKSRKNTSTFSAAGRAMTQIGHMPTGVVLGAGKGVAHVGSDLKGIFKSKDHAKSQAYEVDSDRGSVAELPAGQSSQPINGTGPMSAAAFPTSPNLNGDGSLNGLGSDRGTLRVVVMEAKDMLASDVKPYVVLRVGDKEHKTKHSHKTATPEWNESFTFSAAPATQPKMHAWIYDHKTLGKDKLLGSAEIDLWRHLPTDSGVASAEVHAELREGQGLLRMRLEFDPEGSSPSRSRTSMHSLVGTTAPVSPSRFSLSRRRGADRDD